MLPVLLQPIDPKLLENGPWRSSFVLIQRTSGLFRSQRFGKARQDALDDLVARVEQGAVEIERNMPNHCGSA